MTATKWIVTSAVLLVLLSVFAVAQAPAPQAQSEGERRGLGVNVAAQQQQPITWERMPHMHLEVEYAGPMKDTTIQRWRDPGGNVVCYIYVPFTAQHSQPGPNGYVQYGANTIGTISCVPVLASSPSKTAPSAKSTQ